MILARTIPLAGLIAAALAHPAAAESWNMSMTVTDGWPTAENAQQFAEEVAQATGKALEIDVLADRTVPFLEIPQYVRSEANVQIGEAQLQLLADGDPLFEVDAIPFIAASGDEARALWEVLRPRVAEKLAAQGLTLLYAMPRARNGFATSKPLTSIADFAGQSIRTISINGDRFAEILGANRPDIAFMDVPEAVESGQLAVWVTQPRYVILAGEMGGDIAHYTDAALTQQKLVVIANSDAVEALPEDVRAGLFEAAAAAEARGWEMSEKAREANIAKLKRNGVTVSTASPAFAAELEKIGERMFTEWAKTAGMDGLRLLAAYKSKSKGPGGGN